MDQFLKENGLPGAGEMHQVPLNKVAEIMGADAVMFITVEQYGSKYQVLNTVTIVMARASWWIPGPASAVGRQDRGPAEPNSGSGDLLSAVISAVITQVLNTTTDAAHNLSGPANGILFNTKDQGLLYGPYHPKYDRDD